MVTSIHNWFLDNDGRHWLLRFTHTIASFSVTIFSVMRFDTSLKHKVLHKPSPPVVMLTQTSPADIKMHNMATAVCLISGFHPDKLSVKWLKNWQPISSGVVTSPSVKEDNGTFSANSRLTVPTREWSNGAVYTCQVSHEPTHTNIVKNITTPSGRRHSSS
uniref:Ig-like domain-containing protein n=1 Tax=Callorhinchus milii TaxID=7868 RepID=A0A4W3JAA6_CALMI